MHHMNKHHQSVLFVHPSNGSLIHQSVSLPLAQGTHSSRVSLLEQLIPSLMQNWGTQEQVCKGLQVQVAKWLEVAKPAAETRGVSF
jgi:hypothetical protein